MKNPCVAVVLSLTAVCLMTGCVEQTAVVKADPTWEEAENNPLVPANYKAADALINQLQSVLAPEQPIIIATIVNIDALDKSSTLGRLVSEQVSARFTQKGYRMIEMKFRNNVYVKRTQGELMLTREINELATSHNAQAVIVGTYGRSDRLVFINLKVVQPKLNVVLAVLDYALPLDSLTRPLLY